MDHVRLGIRYRALRQRRGWRQRDLADRCGLSQTLISIIERGRAGQVQVLTLERVAAALDAEYVSVLRWRGGDLDRLVDEGHARLVGLVAHLLTAAGWAVHAEVSYAVYGERGSVDLLAWHAPTRTLLIIEVKTELVSIEETLRRHDQKLRLAPAIAAERLGWRADVAARCLVLPSRTTPRRQVVRHASLLDAAYPLRGAELRQWLVAPHGAKGGILFISELLARRGAAPTGRRRICGRPVPPTALAGRGAMRDTVPERATEPA
jgi:transcriptional regulator with XRE-family HTH domain